MCMCLQLHMCLIPTVLSELATIPMHSSRKGVELPLHTITCMYTQVKVHVHIDFTCILKFEFTLTVTWMWTL